jgi:casein kinase I homolog HRR25
LELERAVYTALRRSVGVPKLHWYGSEGDYTVMVLDALGPNLGTLLEYCGGTFSLKTVLLIAKQALCRLQRMHSRLYAHCDIKPENLVMGSGKQGSTLYIIDLGGSTAQISRYPEYRPIVGPSGTLPFPSIDQNRGLGVFFSL